MAEFVYAFAALLAEAGAAEAAFFVAAYAGEVATAALLLGGMAYSASQRASAARKAKDAYNASLVDRMANVVTSIGQRELVLGRVRKAGTVFFRGSTGTNKEKFFMCVALAGHEIDAVETIYLNDVAVTLDGSGNVTSEPYALSRRQDQAQSFTGNSTVIAGVIDASSIVVTRLTGGGGPDAGGDATVMLDHTFDAGTGTVTLTVPDGLGGVVNYQTTSSPSKAKITTYLGTSTQTADASLMAAFPGQWTTNHRAQGVAYLVCEFDYDESAFPSGIPNVSAVIRGAKCYDPRSGLIAWTENPAIHARQILIHPSFGKRASLSLAEETRIAVAANACDTSTTYTVNGSPETRALFKSGYVVPFGSSAKQALDDVCQAMAGMWAYAAGEFFIKAGVYTAPVITLTDADLGVVKRSEDGSVSQQPIVIGTHKPRADKVNMITARIWRENEQWKKVALPPLAPAAYLARDGAQLAHEIDMPAITYAPQALHVAGVMMRDDRDPLRITLPFKLRAYPLELFDTIALTLDRYGWSSKEFVVLGRVWTIDGLLQLSLKETSATIFQLDAGFAPGGTASNTNLPKPWQIAPPANVTMASGSAQFLYLADGTVVPRVKISWDPITDLSILQGGWIEILYRLPTDGGWRLLRAPASETYVYIEGVADGIVVLVQARTRNIIAASDWTTLLGHSVVGNSSAPAAPSGLTATAIIRGVRLAWTNPADPDLSVVEVWISSASSIGAATHVADVKGTTYDYANLATSAGARYFWVRAVNASGNHSAFTGPASAGSDTIATGDVGTGVITKYAMAMLYQWAASIPGNPSGTSTYTWATGASSAYSGGNGWQNTMPSNPGTAGLKLWVAAKQVFDNGTATSTAVSWTSGFAIVANSQNGNDGAPGGTGAAGSRGSLTLYASGSSWSDATANSAITTASGSSTRVIGDTVTISNGTSFAATKYWSGSSWVDPGVIINGNLLVNGTLSALVFDGVGLKIGTGNTPGGKALEISTSGVVYADNIFGAIVSGDNSHYLTINPITGTTWGAVEGVVGKVAAANTSASAHGVRGFNYYNSCGGIIGAGNGWDFYADGSGSNYGPFTGAHDGLVPQSANGWSIGDIVVDVVCVARSGVSNTIFEVARSTNANQPGVVGVLSSDPQPLTDSPPAALIGSFTQEVDESGRKKHKAIPAPGYDLVRQKYNRITMNALGEGQINVCGQGGNIAAGDLIVASDRSGKGMRQADDTVRAYTVARAREGVTFTGPGDVKQVACVYLCG